MSTLTVTTIQTNLFWEDKKANLANLLEKINSVQEKTEVVILPEMFSTGFSMRPEILAETMDGETITWMKKICAEKKIILTGSVIIEEDGSDSEGKKGYYNRLIWMLPNGEYGFYDKRHLFAYGDEHSHFSAGSKRLIASVKGWKINLQICYDLRFPVWARQNISQNPEDPNNYHEYDLLIFVANWPAKRSLAWKSLLQARAIENQSYVIGVNRIGEDGNGITYSGDSMIIDPLGEILYQKTKEEDVFTYALEKEKLNEVRNKFPFIRDSDSFIINS
ncbi:MAG: amidohydrolase [Ginsengibacter sp.]